MSFPPLVTLRHLALLVALGVGLAACGAGGERASVHPSRVTHAGQGAAVMPVVTPHVRPLSIDGAPPAPSAVPGSGAPPPERVRIPAIGVDSALSGLGLNSDGTIQVPSDPGKAGWYTNGPAPGEPGPAVILGHLDSTTGPAIFYRLAALKKGDQVSVLRADDSEVRFTVQQVASYPVDAFPTSVVYGVTTEPALRLITCGGTFSFTQRRYESNVVVFADMTT